MSKVLYTDSDFVLDQGEPLWPARDDPGDTETIVWGALTKLDDRQRTILEYRHYGELTFKQIGNKLGISKQAAHAAYRKALDQMRRILDEAL